METASALRENIPGFSQPIRGFRELSVFKMMNICGGNEMRGWFQTYDERNMGPEQNPVEHLLMKTWKTAHDHSKDAFSLQLYL